MRAKAKDSSSLHLNHLSTTCGQDPDCRLQEGLGQVCRGDGGPTAVLATSQTTSVQAAVTLSDPAWPRLRGLRLVYKPGALYLCLVQRILHVDTKTAHQLPLQGHMSCQLDSTALRTKSPLGPEKEPALGLPRSPCSTTHAPSLCRGLICAQGPKPNLAVFAQRGHITYLDMVQGVTWSRPSTLPFLCLLVEGHVSVCSLPPPPLGKPGQAPVVSQACRRASWLEDKP